MGSSSTRKFGGSNSILAMTRRAFSPPDRTRQDFSISSPEKPKHPARVRSAPVRPAERIRPAIQRSCRRHPAGPSNAGRNSRCGHCCPPTWPWSGPVSPTTIFSKVDFRRHWRPGRTSVPCGGPGNSARIDRVAAIGLVHAAKARHVIARARRAAEFKLDGLAAAGQFDLLDLVQLLDRLWTWAAWERGP